MREIVSIGKIILIGCILCNSCQKKTETKLGGDSTTVKQSAKTHSITGVISSAYTEDKVLKFFNKHKGDSIEEIVAILGKPLYEWTSEDTIRLEYAIDGRFENPNIGIDFSGFALKFRDDRLIILENRYGYICR